MIPLRTIAKRFAPFVHSTNRKGCLVHEVSAVELQWYTWREERLQHPTAIIHTKCGARRYSKNNTLCNEVTDGAVRCLKCQGLGKTVSQHPDEVGPSGVTRNEAAARLSRLNSAVIQ